MRHHLTFIPLHHDLAVHVQLNCQYTISLQLQRMLGCDHISRINSSEECEFST